MWGLQKKKWSAHLWPDSSRSIMAPLRASPSSSLFKASQDILSKCCLGGTSCPKFFSSKPRSQKGLAGLRSCGYAVVEREARKTISGILYGKGERLMMWTIPVHRKNFQSMMGILKQAFSVFPLCLFLFMCAWNTRSFSYATCPAPAGLHSVPANVF